MICKICKNKECTRYKEYCNACYKRAGTPIITCLDCGKLKNHIAKGLCRSCYYKKDDQREGRRVMKRKAIKEFAQRNPNQQKARDRVKRAIKIGYLIEPKNLICNVCRKKQAEEYDHWKGYQEHLWLDVQPICRKCHIHKDLNKSV